MARNYISRFRGEFTPTNNPLRIKDEPLTPDDYEECFRNDNLDIHSNNDFYCMRKSMSMTDLVQLKKDLEKIKLENDEFSGQVCRKQNGEFDSVSKTKFVSMAEAIYHYQRDTPVRFHSRKSIQCQNVFRQSKLTLAQSPLLRCKERSRPRHIISQKEKEDLEFKEIQKHKLKANPIPKSVIIGSHLPDVPKKPPTVPEPFKLTEAPKANIIIPQEVHNFKARPAPKQILEQPSIPVRPPPKITKPVSPKFHNKRAKSMESLKHQGQCTKSKQQNKLSDKNAMHQGPRKPEPFSFLKRDEELRRRKEEKIKKQIEEDRKLASQFKAQPLPAAVKKRMQTATGLATTSSTASSENKENLKFEAKPPLVLYKEPFKPIIQTNHIIKQKPFELSTERRATEREKFEMQLKEKEEEMKQKKWELEKARQEAEEREVLKMRAMLVHHPKPIPVVDPFVPKTSGKITQKKAGKTAEELQEEEELQLALALSQSEAEQKEKEKRSRTYIAPEPVTHPTLSPTPSSVSASPEHSTTGNSELSRYLDRNYWEQRLSRETTAPTAPSSHGTNDNIDDFVKPSTAKSQEDEAEDKEIDEFVENLKSQVEIFVNRMKSNSSRGRSIANDTSVQTLFMNITAMHSKLLRYIQQQDDKRVYLESLQDKISQVRDSRAALDTLRAEHAARLAQAAEAAERQRQMQMATKLQAMRKKKHEYLQYQRQLALQRVQEQEREMQMRQEQQKHQYMMSSSGYYVPGMSMHQFQPGFPNQMMYNPQFHPQMPPQTTETAAPLPGQPQMSQANMPMNVNPMGTISQSMPQMNNSFTMSTSAATLSQVPPIQGPMSQQNIRPVMGQQLPIQQQMMMQQMQQMRPQAGIHQMMPNGPPGQVPANLANQMPKTIPSQTQAPPNTMMPAMTMPQPNMPHQTNANNSMYGMKMQNIRMPSALPGNQMNNNSSVPVSGYPVNPQNPQASQQPTMPNMQQSTQISAQTMPPMHQTMPGQNIPLQNQMPNQNVQPQSGHILQQPQMSQGQQIQLQGQPPHYQNPQMISQGQNIPQQHPMNQGAPTQTQTLNQQGGPHLNPPNSMPAAVPQQMHASQMPMNTQNQMPQNMQHHQGPMNQGHQSMAHIPQNMQMSQSLQQPLNMPHNMPPQNMQPQGPANNIQAVKMPQQNFGNIPQNQQQAMNQQNQQVQTAVKSENNNNTAELISFD
ncbi:unnamed protein product [Leptosia nina]|uniref:Hepatocyte growth factor-regulated tyrosine kinase substrate n=1 Tax=Leptosia nina TaxID=320188 RepID=A0AAV1JFQ8_9NEOP